jgi:hypothetical protein
MRQNPVLLQKEHNALLSSALPLCVVLAKGEMWQWFHSHYIQIFSSIIVSDGSPWIDFHASFRFQEVLEASTMSKGAALEIGSIIEFLRIEVDKGWCCTIFLDFGHLHGDGSLVHEVLVYGYDDESREVLAIGYDGVGRPGTRRFKMLRFGYATFARAFATGLEEMGPQGAAPSIQCPIQLVKARDVGPRFSSTQLRTEISNYLGATPINLTGEGARYWWWMDPALNQDISSVQNINTGIQVYDAFEGYLRGIERSRLGVDYRPFHALWEHRTSILRRIEYVASEFDMRAELGKAIDDLHERSSEFYNLRLRVLRALQKNGPFEFTGYGISILGRARRSDEIHLRRLLNFLT